MDHDQRRRAAAVMRRNRGHLTTEQARQLGIDDHALSRAVANGELVRVRRRTFRSPAMPASFLDDLAADIACCEREAVAARSSALEVMGLRPRWLPLQREILVKGPCKPLIRGEVIVHRTRSLDPCDTWRMNDFDCTTAMRTVIDLVGGLPHVRRLALLDEVASSQWCNRCCCTSGRRRWRPDVRASA